MAAGLDRACRAQLVCDVVERRYRLAAGDLVTRTSDDAARRYAQACPVAGVAPDQHLVIGSLEEIRLFSNGNLQFAGADEYRYHEALVHPALLAAGAAGAPPRRVLILGGGDGLALREVLAHPVQAVTLVDFDPAMTELGRDFAPLAALNRRALFDPRVEVVNQDAMVWLESAPAGYDAAIIDFPDPNTCTATAAPGARCRRAAGRSGGRWQ